MYVSTQDLSIRIQHLLSLRHFILVPAMVIHVWLSNGFNTWIIFMFPTKISYHICDKYSYILSIDCKLTENKISYKCEC